VAISARAHDSMCAPVGCTVAFVSVLLNRLSENKIVVRGTSVDDSYASVIGSYASSKVDSLLLRLKS
jgi:hypothetical protein